MWLLRCKIALWLTGVQQWVSHIADEITIDGDWTKYDAWAKKRGHYDWLNERE